MCYKICVAVGMDGKTVIFGATNANIKLKQK